MLWRIVYRKLIRIICPLHFILNRRVIGDPISVLVIDLHQGKVKPIVQPGMTKEPQKTFSVNTNC